MKLAVKNRIILSLKLIPIKAILTININETILKYSLYLLKNLYTNTPDNIILKSNTLQAEFKTFADSFIKRSTYEGSNT